MSNKLKIIQELENQLTEGGNEFLGILKKSYTELAKREIDPSIGISLLLSAVVKMERAFDRFKSFILEDN
jgi:hypothetical protein